MVEITQLIDNPSESLFRGPRKAASAEPTNPVNNTFLLPDLAFFLERCTIFGFLRLRKNNYLSMLQWLASLPWFFLFVKHPEGTAVGVFAAIGNWLAVLGGCKCVGMLFGVRSLAEWEPKIDWVSLVLLMVWLVAFGGGMWMQYRLWIPVDAKKNEELLDKASENAVQPQKEDPKVE